MATPPHHQEISLAEHRSSEWLRHNHRRDEQRKIIKYNHLVANLVIFHNVVMMTKVLRQLLAEGHAISAEVLAVLSPYLTAHINRLGLYSLQFDQEPEPIDYDLPLTVVQHPAPLTVAFL